MDKKQNNLDTLQKKLFSGNQEQSLAAIEEIRKVGNLPVISSLFELLATSSNENIQNAIINCISDIKDQLAAPIFIDALTQPKFKAIKKFILYAMWQSSLDYTEDAETIITIIKEDDFETIIEAITVLENIAANIDNRKKTIYEEELKAVAQESISPMKELIEQAIEMLKETPDFTIDPIDIEN